MWRAWTEPEHLKRWFTPAPWTTVDCTIDLRPGGIFSTTMRSPEGEVQEPSVGCYLEVVERRLVFTDALEPSCRPTAKPFMTAIVLLDAERDALHRDRHARRPGEPATARGDGVP